MKPARRWAPVKKHGLVHRLHLHRLSGHAVMSWMRRDTLTAYVALQSTVVGLGLAGLVALELAQVRPVPVEVARWLPLIPLMAAGLFVRFWLMERSASKASRPASYEL